MSTSFMGLGVLLFSLPVLIGQWIGIVGLGKTERSSSWWCMFAGICCTTLGIIGSTLFIGLMMSGVSSPPSGIISFGTLSIAASGGLSSLGSLLFSIGFAIHGQRSASSKQRIAELEAIAAAQGEELNRQRPSY